jgi:4-hydroxy-tetrahydrodipicolinate synthase
MSTFRGLSAFPLTPMTATGPDERGFARLVGRLRDAGVDSIGALGSTGIYPYLDRDQRAQVARSAVANAGDVPVMIGVGALTTTRVLECVEDAQRAGAAAVLLAPVSYHPLGDDEVFDLFATVTRELSVPLCVYDNPGTTRFTFSDELHGRIAALPNVGGVKVPGVPAAEAAERIGALRAVLPERVVLGVSGDAFAAGGLSAGAEAWYSVVGGLFPEAALAITRAALSGDAAAAQERSAALEPLWQLFARHGSLRVVATAAELLGLVDGPALPRPLAGLGEAERGELRDALDRAGLGA